MIKNVSVWADSILKGVIYDDGEKRYRFAKNNAIIETAKENNIALDNNCRFGLTSKKAKRLLAEKIKKESNICLIEIGGNDCDYRWSEVSANPSLNHMPISSIDEYKENITDMIDTLRNNNIVPVIVSLPPIDQDRFIDWVSKGLNKDNILNWLGDKSRIYKHHESYNDALLAVAKQKNCHILDLREAFLSVNYQEMLCSDGIHLNELGQSFVHRVLANELSNL